MLKKLISLTMTITMVIGMCTSAFASQENTQQNNSTNTIEVIKTTPTSIEYMEKGLDKELYVIENFNGNVLTSKIYDVKSNQKTLSSTIISTIQNNQVNCKEITCDGNINTYKIKPTKTSSYTYNTDRILRSKSSSSRRKHIRTDKYSVSLVGKKVTVSIAAQAICAASTYIPKKMAKDIIKTAAQLVQTGVAALPNYIYVTSDVYLSKSCGRIYNHYKNKYYLDSDRSQRIGTWCFSKRWGH